MPLCLTRALKEQEVVRLEQAFPVKSLCIAAVQVGMVYSFEKQNFWVLLDSHPLLAGGPPCSGCLKDVLEPAPWLNSLILYLQVPASHMGSDSNTGCFTS